MDLFASSFASSLPIKAFDALDLKGLLNEFHAE
jgi:hypothetical protein